MNEHDTNRKFQAMTQRLAELEALASERSEPVAPAVNEALGLIALARGLTSSRATALVLEMARGAIIAAEAGFAHGRETAGLSPEIRDAILDGLNHGEILARRQAESGKDSVAMRAMLTVMRLLVESTGSPPAQDCPPGGTCGCVTTASSEPRAGDADEPISGERAFELAFHGPFNLFGIGPEHAEFVPRLWNVSVSGGNVVVTVAVPMAMSFEVRDEGFRSEGMGQSSARRFTLTAQGSGPRPLCATPIRLGLSWRWRSDVPAVLTAALRLFVARAYVRQDGDTAVMLPLQDPVSFDVLREAFEAFSGGIEFAGAEMMGMGSDRAMVVLTFRRTTSKVVATSNAEPETTPNG